MFNKKINLKVSDREREALLSAIYTQLDSIKRLRHLSEMKAEVKLLNGLIKKLLK